MELAGAMKSLSGRFNRNYSPGFSVLRCC